MSCEIIGRAITPEEVQKLAERREHRLAVRRKHYVLIREELNAKRRAKYASDPDFRKRERARKRASDAKHSQRIHDYGLRYRKANADRERERRIRRRSDPSYAENIKSSDLRKKEKMRTDPVYRESTLAYKREWMRRWRAKRRAKREAAKKASRKDPLLVKWEAVANGGPKKVALYMRSAPQDEKQRFLHWYGKRMNWIDSTGSRKFAPPPDADVYVQTDDFFFS